MAEWLGRGLQNLVQRFESDSDLKKNDSQLSVGHFSFYLLTEVGRGCTNKVR